MQYNNSRCSNSSRGASSSDLQRTVIQATKVFDACMSQDTYTDTAQTVDFGATPPTGVLTFVSATSQTQTATVTDVIVELINANCNNRYRVRANINIPINVVVTDAAGATFTGTFTYTIPKDVVMCLNPSNTQYTFIATVAATASSGTYVSDTTFDLSLCISTILKATMEVELVVPSYGYAQIPPCRDYQAAGACENVFNRPLYPADGVSCECENRRT